MPVSRSLSRIKRLSLEWQDDLHNITLPFFHRLRLFNREIARLASKSLKEPNDIKVFLKDISVDINIILNDDEEPILSFGQVRYKQRWKLDSFVYR